MARPVTLAPRRGHLVRLVRFSTREELETLEPPERLEPPADLADPGESG